MPKRINKLNIYPSKSIADNSGDLVAVVASPVTDNTDKDTPDPITWKELTFRAHDILSKLFEPCPTCQKAMVPVHWSGERISIVCGNYACNKYRQPAKYLKKFDVEELINLIARLEMAEITKTLGEDYVKQKEISG